MLEDLENLESLAFYFLSFLKILRILILYKDNINNISLTQHWWATGKEIDNWRSSHDSIITEMCYWCAYDVPLSTRQEPVMNP